ncbi:MAG: MBL fold metallo-hydrolase [Rivularia sp. (in: Bacteria)]|nr:MBL fold metallo-hydrolase [Rivularia sp. MS3]
MTKLLFLGSGCAFTVGTDNYQSNMLLIGDNRKKLLIDCGSDIRYSLYRENLSYLDITDIYISHIHADHIGGLEYIGFSSKFNPGCEKPRLYTDKEIMDNLWNHSLSGGMKYIENRIATLEDFFQPVKIDEDKVFFWNNIQFQSIKVIHVNSGSVVIPSYGLFFAINGFKVFITTDTQMHWNSLGKYYLQADIIFQDCETAKFPSGVHAHYQELLKLPVSVKNKMWLYHYQPGKLPNAKRDGFCGFVERGQEFDLSPSILTKNNLSTIN